MNFGEPRIIEKEGKLNLQNFIYKGTPFLVYGKSKFWKANLCMT